MATWIDRTQTGGDRQVFTWSAWVKITGNLATYNHLATTNSNPGNWDTFRISNNRNFQIIMNDNANQITTNRVFRDTNAWYHFVVAVDTTQSTASDRVKLYVNGIQETSFSTNNPVSQNHNTNFNTNGKIFRIGDNTWSTGSEWFSGLMSDVNFADGNQYSASTFGSTDATTGQWKINTDPTFTLGTNGFTILKNGNTITDQSTNSNNFTLGSGTLTKTEDCPSNVFATMNPLDNFYAGATFEHGNTEVITTQSAYTYCTSTLKMGLGKYYIEGKWTGTGGGNSGVGIINASSTATSDEMTTKANGSVIADSGVVFANGSNTGTNVGSFSSNDIVMIAFDGVNNAIYYGKNGTWLNSGNPTSGASKTGAFTPSSTTGLDYFIGFGDQNSSYSYRIEFNFGNGYFGTTAVTSAGTAGSTPGTFEYDVPTGYEPLSTKGLNA